MHAIDVDVAEVAVALTLGPEHIRHQVADVRLKDRQRVAPDRYRNRLDTCTRGLERRRRAIQTLQNYWRADLRVAAFYDHADSQPFHTLGLRITVWRS